LERRPTKATEKAERNAKEKWSANRLEKLASVKEERARRTRESPEDDETSGDGVGSESSDLSLVAEKKEK